MFHSSCVRVWKIQFSLLHRTKTKGFETALAFNLIQHELNWKLACKSSCWMWSYHSESIKFECYSKSNKHTPTKRTEWVENDRKKIVFWFWGAEANNSSFRIGHVNTHTKGVTHVETIFFYLHSNGDNDKFYFIQEFVQNSRRWI